MSPAEPFISICIPAFKRPENINNLLRSISVQTYTNYEIIITDDSPDDSLAAVLQKYAHLPISYYKNSTPLGTPANWNYGISKAKGQWIKLMHDDDWFATEACLKTFANKAQNGNQFIFSGYNTVSAESGAIKKMSFPSIWEKRILRNPFTLLAWNIIGPPSVTLVHHSIKEQYDTAMKWRVDIDFYVRLLYKGKAFTYINEPLINVGISGSQVTNYCINQPEVELPEGLLLLQKYGIAPLKNILVYDTWWRIIRNVGVRNVSQLSRYTKLEDWPMVILKMVQLQSCIPASVLKVGLFSKACMLFSYFIN